MLSLALDAAHATGGLVTAGRRWRTGWRRLRPRLRLASPRWRRGRAGAGPFAALSPAARADAPAHRARGARPERRRQGQDGRRCARARRRRLGLRRRRRRDHGPARRRPARRRLDPPRPRRPRDEQRREAQLAPRRRAAAPSDRSGHRPTGAHTLARRHRGRPRLRRGRRRREGRAPPGARRAVMARPARPRGALRRPSRRSPTDADLAAVRARTGWRPDVADRLVLRALRRSRRVPAPVGLGDPRRADVRARELHLASLRGRGGAPLPRDPHRDLRDAARRVAPPRPRRPDLARPDARAVHVARTGRSRSGSA